MKMFFHSRLFKFLLPLFAYLLFIAQWFFDLKAVWYANIPEETLYFTKPGMSYHITLGYSIVFSFVLFMILGLIYLIKNPAPRIINYILIGDLFLAGYLVWLYSTNFKDWHHTSIMMFITLVLLAISISLLSKKEQPAKIL